MARSISQLARQRDETGSALGNARHTLEVVTISTAISFDMYMSPTYASACVDNEKDIIRAASRGSMSPRRWSRLVQEHQRGRPYLVAW